MRLVMIVGMLALVCPVAAAAQPYYFHQAGVSQEQFVEDVEVCRELAGMGRAKKSNAPYSSNLYATMAGAFMSGFLNSREQRRHEQAIERICMADKGYTRVAIPKEDFKRLRDMDADLDRMNALFVLASANGREGEELPE